VETTKTIKINNNILSKVDMAIKIALDYEKAMNGKRNLGITGEVGEVLVCDQLKLKLVLDSRSEGFDAIDKDGKHVQIKTRRSESGELPRNAGRTGSFSKHPFNYAVLALLDHNYQLCEIWRANYTKLKPIIEKQKRRSPSLSSFKNIEGEPIFKNNPFNNLRKKIKSS
jgi:hypothetical protein